MKELRAAVRGLLVTQQEANAICYAHAQLSLRQPAWKLVDPLQGAAVCFVDGTHGDLQIGQVLCSQVQQGPGASGIGSSRLLLHNGQQVLLSELAQRNPFAVGAAATAGLAAALGQLAAEAHNLGDAQACVATMVKLAELHDAARALQLPLGPHDPAGATCSQVPVSLAVAAQASQQQVLPPPQCASIPTALLNALAAEWRYAQQQQSTPTKPAPPLPPATIAAEEQQHMAAAAMCHQRRVPPAPDTCTQAGAARVLAASVAPAHAAAAEGSGVWRKGAAGPSPAWQSGALPTAASVPALVAAAPCPAATKEASTTAGDDPHAAAAAAVMGLTDTPPGLGLMNSKLSAATDGIMAAGRDADGNAYAVTAADTQLHGQLPMAHRGEQQWQQQEDCMLPPGPHSAGTAPAVKQAAAFEPQQAAASCPPDSCMAAPSGSSSPCKQRSMSMQQHTPKYGRGGSSAPSAGTSRIPDRCRGRDTVRELSSSEARAKGSVRAHSKGRQRSKSREGYRSRQRSRSREGYRSRERSKSRKGYRSRQRSRSRERSRSRGSCRVTGRSRSKGRSGVGNCGQSGRLYQAGGATPAVAVGSRRRSTSPRPPYLHGGASCSRSRSRSRSRKRSIQSSAANAEGRRGGQGARHASDSNESAGTAAAGRAAPADRSGSVEACAEAPCKRIKHSVTVDAGAVGCAAPPCEQGRPGCAPGDLELDLERQQGAATVAAGEHMPGHADEERMPPALWLQQGAAKLCMALLASPKRKLNAANLMHVLPAGWLLYKAGKTRATLEAWGWLDGLFELVKEQRSALYVTFGPATHTLPQQPALASGAQGPPAQLLQHGAAALRAAVLASPARALPAELLWDVLPPSLSCFKHLGVQQALSRWRWLEGLCELAEQDGIVSITLGPGSLPTQQRQAEQHNPLALVNACSGSAAPETQYRHQGDLAMSSPAPRSPPCSERATFKAGSSSWHIAQRDGPPALPDGPDGLGRDSRTLQEQVSISCSMPAEHCIHQGESPPAAGGDGRLTGRDVWKRLSWDAAPPPSNAKGLTWQTGPSMEASSAHEPAHWPTPPASQAQQHSAIRQLAAGAVLAQPNTWWVGQDRMQPPLPPPRPAWATRQALPWGAGAVDCGPAATGEQWGQHGDSLVQQPGSGGLSRQPPAFLLQQLRCNLRRALDEQPVIGVTRVGNPTDLLPPALVEYKIQGRPFNRLMLDWGLADEFHVRPHTLHTAGPRQWVVEYK